jgi:dihydrodipicolinate synthase/N-acetylneuraminate lyase
VAITINRQQRDAIYQEVVLDLNGLTDLWTEFEAGDFDRARELRDRFVLDMRLLDDLGWEPEVDGEAFDLTMAGVDLAAVVSRLIEQTRQRPPTLSAATSNRSPKPDPRSLTPETRNPAPAGAG